MILSSRSLVIVSKLPVPRQGLLLRGGLLGLGDLRYGRGELTTQLVKLTLHRHELLVDWTLGFLATTHHGLTTTKNFEILVYNLA
jgi:hypothetical protein